MKLTATTGARRLVVQSSLGAGDSGSQLPLPLRLLMKVVLAGLPARGGLGRLPRPQGGRRQ
ncbi:hypothetical protein [Dietzia kunjamensis]|uniref:hypothetical protein n=1 Tax=Dietzia kunjamensis TaxID=322509 RepID=UPI003366EE96